MFIRPNNIISLQNTKLFNNIILIKYYINSIIKINDTRIDFKPVVFK